LTKIDKEKAAVMRFSRNSIQSKLSKSRIGDHTVNIAQWVLFAITGVREGNTN
jgi:hypothetical protein